MTPTDIRLKTKSKLLALSWKDKQYELSFEFLRVHSPSAEVRGHGNPILQTGKRDVRITGLEPSGNYGVKISFDDGHNSGIFSWTYLLDLCQNQDQYWQTYLDQLDQQNGSRDGLFINVKPIK